jgi:uncharacterized protein
VPRRRGRRRAPNPLFPLLLVAIALVIGWFLLRPAAHYGRAPGVAEQSAAPTTTAVASAAPATAAPSATPSATPSAIVPPNGPKLALIIDDCGQWLPTERGFVALDIPITLSVLPFVHGTAEIAQDAHAAGKGVMLHLPMETLSGVYPGPGEITTEMTDAQVQAQMRADLAQVPLAQGVNNHEGSKASADERVMRDVMLAMSEHGDLFFIDSRTTAATVAARQAEAAGIPSASRNVFIDNKETVDYTETQLRQAAAIAQRDGSAIAIGHPRPTTLEAVRAMIPQLEAQGITFVLAGRLTH